MNFLIAANLIVDTIVDSGWEDLAEHYGDRLPDRDVAAGMIAYALGAWVSATDSEDAVVRVAEGLMERAARKN